LSRITPVMLRTGCLGCLKTEDVSLSLIVKWHMGTTIDMNRISRNVKFRYWVLEHGNVPLKDAPVFLRDTIMRLTAASRRKLKGTMNIGIQVGNVKPFLKRQMVVASSIVVGGIGWMNKMRFGGKVWMCHVLLTMVLNPITLVDCVVMPICWMANVKFK
jgi:hypothetical protein